MNRIKYLALAACGILSSGVVLADDTLIDGTQVTASLTQVKTDLTTWVTAALPVLVGIFGVFAIFWLIKFGLRMVKGFARMGK